MNGATSSSSTPSGIQGICPTGWHLPSHDEWTDLADEIDNSSNLYTEVDIEVISNRALQGKVVLEGVPLYF